MKKSEFNKGILSGKTPIFGDKGVEGFVGDKKKKGVPQMENPPPRPKMKDSTLSASGATTKMRIQMFSPDNHLMISDRLIEQKLELLKGPDHVSKGPFGLEITLFSKGEVDMLVDYLKRLKGDLPIEAPGTKVKKDKTIDKMLKDKEPLLDLLKVVKAKGTSQEKIIELLREWKFKFITADVILDMQQNDPQIKEQITLREKDIEKGYQYMVRQIKEAKEPMNDKYDFRLVFGIKIVGDKVSLIPVYLWGKWEETLKVSWEKIKAMNFKKVEKVYIFPEFMDYDDRRKWRKEHRAKITWDKNPNKTNEFETSKFYQKFTPYVKGY